MALLFQTSISRRDLELNRAAYYLFGDNEARAGLGGQAREMRNEPNAIGIRTKRLPSNKTGAFWIEGHGAGKHAPAHFVAMVAADFERVRLELGRGVIVIAPAAGIGTGLAGLEQNAPVTLAYIKELFARARLGRFEVPDMPQG